MRVRQQFFFFLSRYIFTTFRAAEVAREDRTYAFERVLLRSLLFSGYGYLFFLSGFRVFVVNTDSEYSNILRVSLYIRRACVNASVLHCS